ncbi:far upstream element-binding protein 1-like [Chenopodium quinoa]|uniref:K Homology domain-containing protein n=1 Tax=Chenopodium quinoa TaxID=63459 RepID=A0A803LNV9_CHEQI|nr:far upstream element-binding protein 1-like [Chenopodium quinoa]
MESLGNNNGGSGGGVGGKRKIEDQVELAKQKAQAIAARLLSDADSKRPRTLPDSSLTPPDYSSPSFTSSHSSFPVPYTTQTNQYSNVPSSKKIVIPNGKVGVIIGRGGEMIKTLQLESGARIQITRDSESDPSSLTRDVELMGTQEQISRAEQRINEVIAETDATSSAPSGNRGPPPPQAGGEQFVMKVPNDKVALVIGKGGETIKTMQSKSGARIQVVPLHLPPGDASTERNIFINGTPEQIESAKELVNEVISGNRSKVLSGTNTYQQSGYPPSAGWAAQGQPSAQQAPAYGYSQPGAYAPPPYYGGYAPQPNAWDQNQTAAPTQQQSTAYSAYGQAQPPSSTPPHANYNYSQMPPAAGYSYPGYPQQPPSYGDVSAQTTSSQPDGTATVQTSQPGYGAPDGTTQTQPQSAYATGYSQPPAAPANGYSAYPSYSGAAPTQPGYYQAGYPQTGYGQQQEGQVASQASYSYYGQSGYPPSQAPAQAGYYQSGYPPAAAPPQGPPQSQPQATNGASQTSYADGGDSTTGSGAAATEESENPQS